MKNFFKFFVLGVFVVSLFSSCAKQPTQAIDSAKAAIEAASKEGASVYAADELKKLNDDLQAAMDEVNTQSKKFFKSFGTAKEMLAKVQTEADALKATIPAKKEAAKNAALQAQTEAQTALEEAKALLGKAPMGKGTKADIMAMKADLAGLETSFAEIQTAIGGEDFLGASAKAATIKEKATAISDQVKAAMEKVKAKR
jgi:cell division septum initiation protein DivIVA